jgi:hypothetical protein
MTDSFMNRLKILPVLFVVMLLLGCRKDNPQAIDNNGVDSGTTPTQVIPDSELGAIIGRVDNAHQIWPNKPIFVYAAQYYGDGSGDGSFLLEPNLFPKTRVEAGGYFQINNMPPRQYVLIIGPSAEGGLLVKGEEQVLVFNVIADQILEVGAISVNP